MSFFNTAVLAVVVAAVLGTAAPAQLNRTPFPDPARGYQWQEEAKKRKFAAEDIQALARDKVLMTNEAYKQIFTPYVASDIPIFVTADSLLNAFHVLYEESVLRLERANARKLLEILRFLWKNLQTADAKLSGDARLAAAAKARAQIVVGVALRLLGDETVKPDARLAAVIDAEAKRVTEATGRDKPEWLGPPDPGFLALDYTRYRPRGFYTKSKDLERYFRAVSWLQSIPFRIAKDEELLSILMLGNCITYQRFANDFERGRDYERFFGRYRLFVGVQDDWDLLTAAHHAQGDLNYKLSTDRLAKEREALQKSAEGYGKGPKINDQLRFGPVEPGRVAEVNIRILSAYRVPDAVLFQRTTDPRQFTRKAPTGLEVCAALGSSFARSQLTGPDRDKLLKVIDETKPLFAGGSLYQQYLDCLAALLAVPEPDAPAFLSGEPWRIKSCQTALSGWAQLRHTWALQAKQTVHFAGLTDKPYGFVEPNPEFFARMTALVEGTEDTLRRAGVFETDPRAVADDVRALVDLLKARDFVNKGEEAFKTLSIEEIGILDRARIAEALADVRPGQEKDAAGRKAFVDQLARLVEQLEKGEGLDRPKVAAALRAMKDEVGPLWQRLSRICRRLETLAHKQLRRVPFSKEEQRFLIGYGEALAGVMLYGGNSYLTPRDDAPRVVDVFHNPNDNLSLEVGVARARALYVLYPVKGGDILCRGAVLPYYELLSPRRLTDAEWKTLLDSRERPAIPAWVKPIVGHDGIRAPSFEKED